MQPQNKNGRRRKTDSSPRPKRDDGALWLYGRHAAAAALANPNRRIKRGFATRNAMDWLLTLNLAEQRLALIEDARPDAIDRLLQPGAVHQGLALEAFDLERARLKDVCEPDGSQRPVVVLDQITDPQNIGAVFRSAAAFGARAAIVQERRTPPLSGALAKAAAGAIETLPCVKAVNIARALEALKDLGYHCAGLAGESARPVADMPRDRPIAVVLGAEGAGLRQLVGETCDALYRIPITREMESLNVSNAAAIALYEATRQTL
ncbi:MAG TPA: 23S rRNA (guanosine(2251)-2'-O)-methyltransferase RlmB [Parvularcula sp.]|nr:23S rRNA (guanosine(2251)-2'-O)-methyltransferase RlmB [Parvularcula sp.]